jgi:transposase
MTDRFLLHVGIDWGSLKHDVRIADADGQILADLSIEHSSAGIARLLDTLAAHSSGQFDRVAVAIETPRGPVVEALVERGCQVFACNPKQLDRFRDRYSMAGKKDDPFDAAILSDLVRTDRHLLRAIRLDDPLIIELRELERLSIALSQDLTRQTNRLRDQLYRVLPQLLALCEGADEPWLWDLLEVASTPERLARLREKTIDGVLKRNRIRRLTASELKAALGVQPLRVAPGVVEASNAHMRAVLPICRVLAEQRRACEQRIDELLERLKGAEPETEGQHRDAAIIDSLPGVGRVILAAMLAEASQAIAERDEGRLRAEMGVAPVTRRSGKSMVHTMRYACNRRLKHAAYWWGMAAIVNDPVSRARYRAARARGHKHARALRGVVESLIRVMMGMLRDGTLYDAGRRGAQRPPRRDSGGSDMQIPA